MIIGIDYWNTISRAPEYFRELAHRALDRGDEVHVVSAVGKNRTGTVEKEVRGLCVPFTAVHEVVFTKPSESPWLKLWKCRELGVKIFYDDRLDVCRMLTADGIIAFQVHRPDKHSDTRAERR